MNVKRITPVLLVKEIEPIVPFWVDRLGFAKTIEVPEGNKLGFVTFQKGTAEVMYQTYSSVEKDAPKEVLETARKGPTYLYMEVDNLDAVLAAMKEAGFNVTHLYGLTETYGPAVVNDWHASWNALIPAEQAARKARQGVRYPVLEGLDVIDPDSMQPVPRDGATMGEVMFRGNVVMKGYLKNRQASASAFAGGWFHSGDLGVMHPDGYIQLKDRSKDIIISGGENISSIEVEDALYKHPAVQAAAVVAKPDDKWGETPCAFVELKPGSEASADELMAWCRKNLASFKCPRYVIFTELPKTSTGKIQKFKLREMAQAV